MEKTDGEGPNMICIKFFKVADYGFEKPAAIMNNTGNTFFFLLFGEYQTCFRVLIHKTAYNYEQEFII